MNDRRPLLLREVEPLIPADPIEGRYDEARGVWTISVDGHDVPLVASGGRTLDIQTKTKVLQETDDEIPAMLELMTKTFVEVERDEDDDEHAFAAKAAPRQLPTSAEHAR